MCVCTQLKALGVDVDPLSDLLWPSSTRARKRKSGGGRASGGDASSPDASGGASAEDASTRRAALNTALRAGGSDRVIVADAAATRGLHLDGISTVVVLGLAANADTYLHLAGRTGRWQEGGRANAPGSAVAVTVAIGKELQTLKGWANGLGGLKFESLDDQVEVA